MKNKFSSLAKDTVLFSISNFGSKILILLLTPLYTSVLSTDEYGIADLIMTTINFIYPVLTLAIAEGTLRFALDNNKNSEKVLSTSMMFVSFSVILLLLISPVVSAKNELLSNYWIVFVITYALYNYHNCLVNYAKGIGKTTLFAIQGIVMTISVIISNILFLLVFKIGLAGYLISIIVGYIISILVMTVGCKIYKFKKLFSIEKSLLKEMLVYSLPMVPTILSWAINSSIDKYMIIGFIGLGASGIYSVAHKIPSILTTVLSLFLQAWQISAIENHGEDDESDYYTVIYKYLDFLGVVGCILIAMFSKTISRILFAEVYFGAWQCVPLLTVSAIFSTLAGFLAAAFRASKKTKDLFYSVIVGAVFNVVMNAILIPTVGVLGAAIATAISFMAMWLVRFVTIQHIVRIKININKTIITYVLFLGIIIYITMDMVYASVLGAIVLILIIFMYKSEVKKLFNLVIHISKKSYIKN